jgi:branched-chain amino acid transport system permease protein
MFYKESGQFQTHYKASQRLFRFKQDRILLLVLLAFSFLVIPLFASNYWLNAILIPFLIFSLAGIGLNLLTGYAGQLSLGSAAFMAVGAYTAYNFQLRVEDQSILLSFLLSGLVTAAVGVLFGLPSLRIKGFYLLVSTLAAQFLIIWIFTRFPWFSNYSTSGVITAPPIELFGYKLTTPAGKYLFTLSLVTLLTLFAFRVVKSELGRQWMAVRDMDTAAAVIGIPVAKAKLLAFAVSSFILGIAGALWAFAYLGTVEPHGFDLTRSFQILFIIIIGGMSSIFGNFIGAAFIVILPILLSSIVTTIFGNAIDSGILENIQKIIYGLLIIFLLIKEPQGIYKLLNNLKNRSRVWPLRI